MYLQDDRYSVSSYKVANNYKPKKKQPENRKIPVKIAKATEKNSTNTCLKKKKKTRTEAAAPEILKETVRKFPKKTKNT